MNLVSNPSNLTLSVPGILHASTSILNIIYSKFLPFECFEYHTSCLKDTFIFPKSHNHEHIHPLIKRTAASSKKMLRHWGLVGQEHTQNSRLHSCSAHRHTGYTEHRGKMRHIPTSKGYGKRVQSDSELHWPLMKLNGAVTLTACGRASQASLPVCKVALCCCLFSVTNTSHFQPMLLHSWQTAVNKISPLLMWKAFCTRLQVKSLVQGNHYHWLCIYHLHAWKETRDSDVNNPHVKTVSAVTLAYLRDTTPLWINSSILTYTVVNQEKAKTRTYL